MVNSQELFLTSSASTKQNQKIARPAAGLFRSRRQIILFSTSLTAVLVSMVPLQAHAQACSSTVSASCTNATTISGSATGITTSGSFSTLTNTNTGTISGSDPSTSYGITGNAQIGTLSNAGTISANTTGSNSTARVIYNTSGGNIGLLENTGTISTTSNDFGLGIVNAQNASIGTLDNSGLMIGTIDSSNNDSSSAIQNAGSITTINNSSSITWTNNGAGGAYGIYNKNTGTISSLSNSSTITTSVSGLGNAFGIFNQGGFIDTVTNTGSVLASATEQGGKNQGVAFLNNGTINTLTNSGTLIGTTNGTRNGDGINLYGGTVGTINNSGLIKGTTDGAQGSTGYGIVTGVTVGEVNNSSSGTITGSTDALYIDSSGSVGAVNNSGTMDGNIDNESNQSLTINGATGNNFGTLTGYNNTVGMITSTNANLVFSSGNTFLNDDISAAGHTVSNTGAVLSMAAINLNLDGNYTQSSTGTFEIEVTPDAASELSVTNEAQLAGKLVLNVAQENGYKLDSQYTILTANDVNGTFSFNPADYSTSFAGSLGNYLTLQISYTNNAVNLSFVPYVEQNGTMPAFTSGQFYGSSLYAQNTSLFDVLQAPTGTDVGYWMHGIGEFGHIPGTTYNYKGFIAGRGFNVSPHLIVGAAISNVYTNANGLNASSVSGTSFGAIGYGIYTLPEWCFTGSAMVGHLGNSATRNLPGVGTGHFATNGIYSGASVRAQYNWLQMAHLFITPYAELRYLHANIGSGQETGLNNMFNMNLHYGRVDTNLAQASGGLTTGYKTSTKYGLLTSWVSLGGTGTLGNTHTRIMETLGTQTVGVTAQTASTGAFTPAVGIKLAGQSGVPWKLSADWQGQFATRASAQAFTIRGSYYF